MRQDSEGKAARSGGASARSPRIRAGAWLWLVNVALAAAVCTLYLPHAPRPGSLGAAAVLGLQLASSAITLTLPVGLLLLVAALVLPWRRLLAPLSALLWTALQIALLVDTRIYGIFRYHFNGLVWNVITTPGADEAVHIRSSEWLIVAVGAALLATAQAALHLWLLRRELARDELGLPTRRLARPAWIWACALLPVLVADKAVYAGADALGDRGILASSRVFPFYQRVTLKRFLSKRLGLELAEREAVDLPGGSLLLDYPHARPQLDPERAHPSIVLVAVESLRADMLAPETMPRTSALAPRARVFTDHLSGGNATRFGIFSLVYGLHGVYWRPVLNEQRSPVLVDTLLAAGYEMTVLSAASMDFPEFSSTAWARIADRIEDRIPSQREGGRDDGVADRFEQWLDARAPGAPPFFAFVQLDGPHQPYNFPDEHALFQPYAEGLRYLEIAGGAAPDEVALIFNRYRNSVHYVDSILGQLVDALDARGLADDTLVVLTGDHGQEFFENGFFGHTSNFTREQTQVPLVLMGPGIEPGVETRPTSHLDVPPTLLELCGADPALRAEWCLGSSLLDPDPDRRRIVSGWDDLALIAPGGIVRVPFESYGGLLEAFDAHWRPLADERALIRAEGPALLELALECRRFLK